MADSYDEFTRDALLKSGLPTSEVSTRLRSNKNLPYTTAGLPSLKVREMPFLEDTNAMGLVFDSNRIKDQAKNQGAQQNIFVAPSAGPDTVAHEAEHLLARQNTGFSTSTRDEFLKMLGTGSDAYDAQDSFLNGLKASLPYLKEKYGIANGYMNPNFIDKQGKLGLYEIFATLAGTEAAKNVDLTKDPELRKTMFSNKRVREAYNAGTGLRQTRTDAKDLPPYTRVPEVEPKGSGLISTLRSKLGFSFGGHVPNAGNKKLI